jgi:hypothetical protein
VVPTSLATHPQSYVRSHLSTAIFVADFLKHGRAAPEEHERVEDHIAALQRLHQQVKYVAAPPKPKDMTSMMAKGLFVDYSVLCKGSYGLYE